MGVKSKIMSYKGEFPVNVVSEIKQDAYTGENRCQPCTLVNVVLALMISISVAFISGPLGIGVLVLSLATIYLRGYLIPGTPALTKQYFPDRVLRWFDKDTPQPQQTASAEESLDFEDQLFRQGILQPVENGTDVVLSSEFQTRWSQNLNNHSDSPDRDVLREALDANIEDGVFSGLDETLTLSRAGTLLGQWPSPAAIKADLAAAEVCTDWISEWETFDPMERAKVLRTIRVANTSCPLCEGTVKIQKDVRETCCNSYDVIIASCRSCDSRLFETEVAE